MKAPEKLYLRKRNKLPLEVARGGEWHETDPQCIYGSIEYIRTDAFIEKACKWLEDNLLDYWGQKNAAPDSFIEDFRNHLKR